MTTAYDFPLRALTGAPLDLAAFRGRPLLIVNTASQCGFTPQYAGLQSLWDEYKGRGLVVVGVPCNDFGGQEPGTAEEISAFCEGTFKVTFPLSEKRHIRGRAADPLFQWLAHEAGPLGRPLWNFTKYLIGPDGELADWFFCFTTPSAARVKQAVERVVRA
ncbi:MAG: glutathione peroxidase [Proteobacteria bacterium]|nr:glutathione peroxidase [Pseudomonadota bacterium]